MSSIFEDPLADVPVDLREDVKPFLNAARKIGCQNAEQISTYMPLPWSELQGAEIIALAVNGLNEVLRAQASELPAFVVTAMQRAMVGALMDRLDELFAASGGSPRGGRA